MKHQTHRKEKKSFTLSRASVVFLESQRKERKSASASEVLDELIREAESRHRQEKYGEAVTAYYDSITDEEREEQKAWAKLSLKALRSLPE
jgi:hypothetical protein